jgi:hypothetical protein
MVAVVEEADNVLFRASNTRHRGSQDLDQRERFDLLADELETVTLGLSSTRRAMFHPAFTEILAMGQPAVPGALRRLRTSANRPLWLRVLGTLTPFPPGAGQDDIDSAVDAWLRWGGQQQGMAA